MATFSAGLRVRAGFSGRWMVLTVAGDLDFATCPRLMTRLDEAIDARPEPALAVDLVGLEFSDSSALRCLVVAAERTAARGGRFLLVRAPRMMRMKLLITGLDKMLPLAEELPAH